MQKESPSVLFAGPSLTPESITLAREADILLKPPVRRHDISRLLEQSFHGRIIIADGVFQQVMAVGHVEIRTAMEKGNTVFGLCSMGAIRAYEMRHLGMIGYGKVYARFFEMPDFQDDELALLYDERFPDLKVSEPLIHFRECIDSLLAERRIDPDQASRIIDHLKSLYFGKRTMRLFEDLIATYTGFDFSELIPDFNRFRIKSDDLIHFLQERIWKKE